MWPACAEQRPELGGEVLVVLEQDQGRERCRQADDPDAGGVVHGRAVEAAIEHHAGEKSDQQVGVARGDPRQEQHDEVQDDDGDLDVVDLIERQERRVERPRSRGYGDHECVEGHAGEVQAAEQPGQLGEHLTAPFRPLWAVDVLRG